MLQSMALRWVAGGMIAIIGVGVFTGCADCGCGRETAEARQARLRHDLEVAHDETWRVVDLTRHMDADGHVYWTFTYNPQSPGNPLADPLLGRVESQDLLAQRPVGPSHPQAGAAAIILVKQGSIAPVMPTIFADER